MLLTDEIRGRLAEVYSLRDKRIDHVVHGALASLVCYGAMLGATMDQIESATGAFVAHFVPFRAIRHGRQLSDSKGASAAISTEAAIQCVHRAMRGFRGPADVFRNPQALWCLFEEHEEGESPFDLHLRAAGGDFAVMGMHLKIGLYEHQSAGALEGLIELLTKHPGLAARLEDIESVRIAIYEPAFSIIADAAKKTPATRQSADHSLPYIMAACLKKAVQQGGRSWKELMLMPEDYSDSAIRDPVTAGIMRKIEVEHGGEEFDRGYPQGLPAAITIKHKLLGTLESGMIMFPEGHARNSSGRLRGLLDEKFRSLARPAVDDAGDLEARCVCFAEKSAEDIASLYNFRIRGW